MGSPPGNLSTLRARTIGGLDLAKGDPTKTVFIAGSGRSGTTWLSNLVNHDASYRLVFEPFHPGKVPDIRGWSSKQYLRPEDRRQEFLQPARRVLAGEVQNGWTERGGAFVARRRIVKDIRANLLLGWMARNFPGMPIVLLIRHPCAVVLSRLALGWRDNLDEVMRQDDLVEDHLLPVGEEILAARDPFERHLYLWCIDNYVPLKQFAPGGIHTLFYENLVRNPEAELRKLFGFVGRNFDERVLGKLDRPSFTSRKEGRSVDGWRSRVGAERIGRAREILRPFGLDRLYGADDAPNPEGALSLTRGGGPP